VDWMPLSSKKVTPGPRSVASTESGPRSVSDALPRKKKAAAEAGASSPRRRLTVTRLDAPVEAVHLSAEQRAWIENAGAARPLTVTHGGLPSPGKKELSNAMKKSLTYGEDLDPRHGIVYACRKGLKPESPNQDDFVVALAPDYHFYGVFDGHGPHGHHVANLVARKLPSLVAQHPRFPAEPSRVLPDAFRAMQERIREGTEGGAFNANTSGTTASVVVVRDRWLWCAWVGDSRVALARGPSWAEMRGEDVSWDHKPELPDEKARIVAHGGRVHKYPGDVPHRVCSAQSAFPGLAMSRSFGDFLAGNLGVSHEPSLATFELSADMQVLILCSDGIWEFLSTEEVVSIVRSCGREHMQEAAERLCKQSWDLWIEEEGDVVDDLTAVLIDMQQQCSYSAILRGA